MGRARIAIARALLDEPLQSAAFNHALQTASADLLESALSADPRPAARAAHLAGRLEALRAEVPPPGEEE